MRATVSKWGNSLAVRLPQNLAADLELVEGSELDLTSDAGHLVGVPAKPRYRLSDLLATVQSPTKEFDWGAPQGKEVW